MRRARIRTDHGDSTTARAVAGAIRPDNTAEMHTRVDGSTVATTIERETSGGLHATVDDYVVNLQVAAQLTDQHADAPADGAQTDTNTDT
ncbi:MAG: KEOPS complex subunit Pcc1 [Haloarculaceae archaeon]